MSGRRWGNSDPLTSEQQKQQQQNDCQKEDNLVHFHSSAAAAVAITAMLQSSISDRHKHSLANDNSLVIVQLLLPRTKQHTAVVVLKRNFH